MGEIKKFGDVKPGDILVGSEGNHVKVTEVYDEHIPESMWSIETEDGNVLKVSGNHLWYCETQLDWELHSLRKKNAKKLLKNITDEAVSVLEEAAEKNETVETNLIDMVSLLGAEKNQDLTDVLERIADSIGHVAENKTTFEDIGGYGVEEENIRAYDARIFSQQILKLTGRKKYKKYKLIIGSVMTTDQMVELSEMVELPISEPLGP